MPVPEDVYKADVDFVALALQYPGFAKQLKPNQQLDFSDPESVRQLTQALLHRDFGLTIQLPEDRLCPPVPNRFNYILFAQRLIDSTRLDYSEGPSSSTSFGFDIGTGASAIYPLLACRQRSSWAFFATEIDAKSRGYAEQNIHSNQLQRRIKILDCDPSGKRLLPTKHLEGLDDHTIRIQITNPPFYASKVEMIQSAKQKARPPNSACTGSPVEMIAEGGEVSFVSKLINESSEPANRTKIQWFSSMLGKLSSVSIIVARLQEEQCTNYAVTEFIQGQKTRRWCVAWSWLGIRPSAAIARAMPSLDKKLLPFRSELQFGIHGQDSTTTGRQLDKEVSKLDLRWQCAVEFSGGLGISESGDVWSRKARRRKQNRDEEMEDVTNHTPESSEADQEPALVFRITISNTPDSSESSNVHLRWVQGHDHVIFESFCGWLKRRLQVAHKA